MEGFSLSGSALNIRACTIMGTRDLITCHVNFMFNGRDIIPSSCLTSPPLIRKTPLLQNKSAFVGVCVLLGVRRFVVRGKELLAGREK